MSGILRRTYHPDHILHGVAAICCGRAIAGAAIGALSAAVPMVCPHSYPASTGTDILGQYQAETAPSQLRGTLTATYQLFITAGILTACMYCL